jgi:DNA polymerase-3 subunit delta
LIRPDTLAGLLAKAAQGAGLPPLTWIASDEPLLQIEQADAVRAAARGMGFDERQVFHVERGFKLDALLHEANALSLFATRRLLELRLAGKPGKELGEALADAVPRFDADTRLLVTSPKLERASTESAWFGRIDRAGWVIAIPEVERAQLPRWIAERLGRNGQQADPDTLRLIAERVEGNLLAAEQEVRKLALLLPAGRLDADAVRAAVLDVARWDAFDLVNAALAGDTARALRCLHGLRAEGAAVPLVLWGLAEAVRNLQRLALARSAGKPLGQAMRELRIWGERERLSPAALARLSPAALRQLMRACARVDRMTKGVLAGDDWQAVEAVVLGLAGSAPLAFDAEAMLAA